MTMQENQKPQFFKDPTYLKRFSCFEFAYNKGKLQENNRIQCDYKFSAVEVTMEPIG